MNTDELREFILTSLDDMKARDVTVLDVHDLTTITDVMIICSGTSDRHVRSIASALSDNAKKAGVRPYGVEGEGDGEWVLVDLGDAIVHIMQPRVRDFYNLEKLWDMQATKADKVSEST